MGIYSHDLDRRATYPPPRLADAPRCEGQTMDYGYSHTDDLQCRFKANPFVPEVNYCGTHLPEQWVTVLLARRRLWDQLAADVWREILAEIPLKP